MRSLDNETKIANKQDEESHFLCIYNIVYSRNGDFPAIVSDMLNFQIELSKLRITWLTILERLKSHIFKSGHKRVYCLKPDILCASQYRSCSDFPRPVNGDTLNFRK